MKTILYSINEWCIQAKLDATLGTALWLYGFFSLNLGVEKLVGVYRERPNFADQDAQEDAKQRLCQVSQYRFYVQCIYELIYLYDSTWAMSVSEKIINVWPRLLTNMKWRSEFINLNRIISRLYFPIMKFGDGKLCISSERAITHPLLKALMMKRFCSVE